MTASLGTLGKLGIDSSNPVTKMFDFVDEDFVMREELIDANGVSGTRSRHQERVRSGLQRINGPINFQPNALELSYLLPWILGANASGNTFALAETLQTRYVAFDRIAKVHTVAGVAVDSATFTANQGEPLKVGLQCVGQSETVDVAGSFPAIAIDLTTQPFILSDLVLTIGGTAVTPKSMELTLNNMIDKDRFFNSNTLSGILAQDRQTTFKTSIPFDSDFAAIYNSGASGAAVVATFTNGNTSLVISLASLAFPRRTPNVPGRREVMMQIEGTAYMTGTTKELVMTLDSTP